MSFGLFNMFSNDAADNAAEIANKYRQEGYNQLSSLYGQGRDAITSGYGKAGDAIRSTYDMYKPGAALYGDATGAGGVAGLKRAGDIWKNSEGYGLYNFANEQAQQAVNRARSASGNQYSGNADFGAAKTASDLAGTHWGSFVSGLAPYLGQYSTAASNLGNVYTGEAGALDRSFTGQGSTANATQTGIGQNLAGAELNNYQVGRNQFDAIKSAASLAATGGLSGGLSGLFSGFGGNGSSISGGGGGYDPNTNMALYSSDGQRPLYA
jgi:hypothetical protein